MKIADVVPNFQKFIPTIAHLLPENLNNIIVFGSYARGEAKVGSDLDLALVADAASPIERLDREITRDILSGFSEFLEISLFCTNQTKIDTTQNKFDANFWIREEGETIWLR